ncbi:MAG: biotin--[acetyl-CoA-carboxylase] ligase, partial [Candidatus Omnitrophica bacterium]|nr:biotin--[acetyl-CoA-carboxylase] ligase [Candidatus Omnitrophota bacterium]
MKEKILSLLKESSQYLSGEEISKQLKISRQALWKHIQEFKDLGYEIEAVPHLGYKLISVPDRLFPEEIKYRLNTKIFGRKIYYFEIVDSTMDIAFELGLKNEAEGTLVIAEGQKKGRGRLNRCWYSPKYKGIYLSLIIKPKVLPNQAPVFTLMSAVSVCKAIKSFTGIDSRIKWPNDIIVNERKLGGILTEINAETDQVHFLVIGIGLNVNNDKKSLMYKATSLKIEKKQNIDRIGLLR